MHLVESLSLSLFRGLYSSTSISHRLCRFYAWFRRRGQNPYMHFSPFWLSNAQCRRGSIGLRLHPGCVPRVIGSASDVRRRALSILAPPRVGGSLSDGNHISFDQHSTARVSYRPARGISFVSNSAPKLLYPLAGLGEQVV